MEIISLLMQIVILQSFFSKLAYLLNSYNLDLHNTLTMSISSRKGH